MSNIINYERRKELSMAKIVHYYDAENDIVYIDTIWDMRMNPKKLQKSIQ